MYKSLQAGRALAAVLVVLFHLGGSISSDKYFGISWMSVPFSFGKSGVEFFFVLSGFIIFSAHKSDLFKPNKLEGYLKKRIVRIYPTYWIIFISVFIVVIATPSLRNAIQLDPLILLKSLLLIPQDKNVVGGTGAPILIVAWSLQYEILFYVLFAVLILSRLLSMALAVSIIAAYLYLKINHVSTLTYPLSFFVNDYIAIFMMGMVISFVYQYKQITKIINVQYPTYFFLGIVLFFYTALVAFHEADIFTHWGTILYGLASCFIIIGLVQAEDKGITIGKHPWMQLLGDSSYALYLIHFPLISILCKLALLFGLKNFGLSGAVFSYFLIFSACIFSAVLFHIWVERPLSIYLKKRFVYPQPIQAISA